ncbi:MAG TPA: TIGR01777 family oxidoreductase [Gemmatimonadaceae bacterium]|nr:TIGR01777 family oxidoreductase [Gemmatimonadaceae bacterium]
MSTRRIAIAGARGFIGSALSTQLRSLGHVVLGIGRSERSEIRWEPATGALDPRALDGVDVVVNVVGAPIDQRWTADARREIRDSRVQSTALLARTIAALPARPSALVNMSGIGIYGDRGDELLDESSAAGSGFLAEVGRAWEEAAQPARDAGIRVVHPRMAPVLHPDGGMLPRLLPIFRLGAGGIIGSGRQWLSWITRTDAVRGLAWLALESTLAGPVNLVSPQPARNADFMRTLARVLRRPALAVVPAFAVKLLYGRMGEETVVAGQRVLPRRLLDAGFAFSLPELEAALRYELGAG